MRLLCPAAAAPHAARPTEEYDLRAGLRGQPDDLGFGIAVPDGQITAAGSQAFAQIGEALQQEAGPVRRCGHQPGVHREQGHHQVRLFACGGEGWVVAYPQVAGK